MAAAYDVIVIGAGPGGYVAAIRAAQLGLKVVIVEREHLGGICLNWGCIPTKALLRSAEVFHLMHRAKEFGLKADGIGYDLPAVVARSRGVAKQLSSGIGHLMKKNKITVVMGQATVTAKGKVTVKTDKGSEDLTAPHIILATGARARELPGLEADGDLVWTYKHALQPKRMPKKLLVIGSGAIGIEFASFFNTLGADTTVVEVMDRILPVEDAEISAFAKKQFVKQGMKILEKAGVKKLDRKPGVGVTAHIEMGGKIETHDFDTVISAVGIVGNVENLGLEALGVKIDRTHVITDEYCRTGVEGLYAIGDIAGAPWLAHKASHEGVMVAELIAGKASAPDQAQLHRGLHLLPPAGRIGRPDRGEGQGSRLRHQGRPLPLHRQWQGHRTGRIRRHDQDDLRRENRRIAGRPHGRRGSDRADSGLCRGPCAGDDRGRPDEHRLPASHPVRDDARSGA